MYEKEREREERERERERERGKRERERERDRKKDNKDWKLVKEDRQRNNIQIITLQGQSLRKKNQDIQQNTRIEVRTPKRERRKEQNESAENIYNYQPYRIKLEKETKNKISRRKTKN